MAGLQSSQGSASKLSPMNGVPKKLLNLVAIGMAMLALASSVAIHQNTKTCSFVFKHLWNETGAVIKSSDRALQPPESKESHPFVIIHVGPWKTGTTDLQSNMYLHMNTTMRSDQYELPFDKIGIGRGFKDVNYLHEYFGVHYVSSKAPNHSTWTMFVNFLRTNHDRNRSIILSAEQFQSPKMNLTLLSDTIAAHSPSSSVRIVVGYRRIFSWIQSSYYQRYRTASEPFKSLLDEFSSLHRTVNTFHTEAVVSRYKAVFDDVVVVNMHHPEGLRVDFFCNLLPLAKETCENIRSQKNVNKKGVGKRLDMRRLVVKAIDMSFLNITTEKSIDMLEKDVRSFVHLTSNESMQGLPKICMSDKDVERLLNMSLKHEERILPVFFETPFGEKALRDEFAEMQFCELDVDTILQDRKWVEFIQTL